MACVGEDNDGEGCEGGDGAGPFEDTDGSSVCYCVAFEEVGYD